MLENIRIILVQPSHPGNIGAVARAMKTMELQNLYLVNPKKFPHVDATARAAGADDILAQATITSSLTDALAGSCIIFGTSARLRELSLETFTPKKAAKMIAQKAQTQPISIVFGRENNGLSNEELECCNYHIHIPTNHDFSSLNIASAVQLIAYEIKMASITKIAPITATNTLAEAKEIQQFYEQLQEALVAIKFLDLKRPRRLISRLKRLFNRAQLEKTEINILRGILAAILKNFKSSKKEND